MKRATIAVRTHSGWAALVALSCTADTVKVLQRRRIVIADSNQSGSKQPFHFAETLELSQAEAFVRSRFEASLQLASAALTDVLNALPDHRVVGCAVLQASGRPLPPLANILRSHALIHTAEGEFFRDVVSKACEQRGIPVTRIPERTLQDAVRAACGTKTTALQKQIVAQGRLLGPPWTQDQKFAALAALAVLAPNR